MTLARRLALGLGLVMVIAVVARVAWMARRSGAASTSAQHRSSPPEVPSRASAPAPPPPHALQRSASAVPSQAAPGRPPTRPTLLRTPAPGSEDQATREPPSPGVDQGLIEHPPDEVPTKAATAPRRARRLEQSAFQRRLQPGLCTDPREAAHARETL
ncbi:MAG TPA: hypothetical protein VL242_30540, partial [Sorangium sp.]|nr:hypothetical protein [Sorangium sp.]